MRGKLFRRVKVGRASCFRTLSPKTGLRDKADGITLALPASHYPGVMDALGYSPADVASGLVVRDTDSVTMERIGSESFTVSVSNRKRDRDAFVRCATGAGLNPVQCVSKGKWLVTAPNGAPLAEHCPKNAQTVVWYWFRDRNPELVASFVLTCRFVLSSRSFRYAESSGADVYCPLDYSVKAKRASAKRRLANLAAGRGFLPLSDKRRIAYYERLQDGPGGLVRAQDHKAAR
jgi:hypothetical protein